MSIRTDPWPAGTPCWVDVTVPDVAAATTFYGSVMGWTFVDTGEEFGHYNLAQTKGHNAAAISPAQQEGQPAVLTVYIASDDVDATTKRVADNGGRIMLEPMDVSGAGRMAIAQDTAGGVFGVWQSAEMTGTQIVNEPGSLAWTDARLTDPEAGKAFYAAVFGYTYEPIPGGPPDYSTFKVGDDIRGGIGGMMGASPEVPSHWLPYFSVVDVDAAIAAAESGGGRVLVQPMDTQFGRMATLADPFGAVFSLHAAIGE
jgi:predicted enzyme related to lactoylglutathione lyase